MALPGFHHQPLSEASITVKNEGNVLGYGRVERWERYHVPFTPYASFLPFFVYKAFVAPTI
jgi:hypothetical protein